LQSEPYPRRGRPKLVTDEERRQVILAAAHEVFVDLGFARATTSIIAAKAKVSKRSIYDLFTDKTELFGEIVRRHRHTILALPRPKGEELPLFETLVAIFRLDVDEQADREREALLNLIARESAQYPELSAYLYDNDIIRSREDLMDWLEGLPQRGALKVDDPALIAGLLMDVVFGALLPRRKLLTQSDRDLRNEHIKKRLMIIVQGLRAS
jgi:AcrR family transcriptional regulator